MSDPNLWSNHQGPVNIPRWAFDRGIYEQHICGLELTLSQVQVDPDVWGWSAKVRDFGSNTEDSQTFSESAGDQENLLMAASWAEKTAVAWDDPESVTWDDNDKTPINLDERP